MARTGALSPYLPSKPMTVAQQSLFDQNKALAFWRAGFATRRYGLDSKKNLQSFALVGLMYAAVRYETPSTASFATFAAHTIDWTIRNLMLADRGAKRVKKKKDAPKTPQVRYDALAYQAAGELPETVFELEAGGLLQIDLQTPEDSLHTAQRERFAQRLLGEIELETSARNFTILRRSLDGEQLASIARDVGISRERCRQIVKKLTARAAMLARNAA